MDYKVEVSFCGYIGVTEEYIVDAESEEDAIEQALELAAEDLSVESVETKEE